MARAKVVDPSDHVARGAVRVKVTFARRVACVGHSIQGRRRGRVAGGYPSQRNGIAPDEEAKERKQRDECSDPHPLGSLHRRGADALHQPAAEEDATSSPRDDNQAHTETSLAAGQSVHAFHG